MKKGIQRGEKQQKQVHAHGYKKMIYARDKKKKKLTKLK